MKSRPTWLVLAIIAVATLVAGFALGSSNAEPKVVRAPQVTTTATVTATAVVTDPVIIEAPGAGSLAAPQSGQFTDGMYLVGQSIAAGNYETAGGPNCYWERLSNVSGGFSAIIANGEPKTAATVSVLASDKAFNVKGGCWWSRVQ